MENEITPRLHRTPQNATLSASIIYQPRDDTTQIPKQGNTLGPSADDNPTPSSNQDSYLNILAAGNNLTPNQGLCLDTLIPLEECQTLYFRRADGTVGKRSIQL
jgi:hypothetical protein